MLSDLSPLNHSRDSSWCIRSDIRGQAKQGRFSIGQPEALFDHGCVPGSSCHPSRLGRAGEFGAVEPNRRKSSAKLPLAPSQGRRSGGRENIKALQTEESNTPHTTIDSAVITTTKVETQPF